MPKYDIERWDAIIPPNNTFPMPAIYIRANERTRAFFEKEDQQILVEIQGTDSDYDGKKLVAVSNNSGVFPNYRPNFYNRTRYYILVLFSEWKGYPLKMGSALISGANQLSDDTTDVGITAPFPTPDIIPGAMEPFYETSYGKKPFYNSDRKEKYYIVGIVCLLFLIILTVFRVKINN